jgi:hypothetical protein
MKPFSVCAFLFLALSLLFGPIVHARSAAYRDGHETPRYRIETSRSDRLAIDQNDFSGRRSAAQETTWLAVFPFDLFPHCLTEGWVSVDRTAQVDDFFHVDDFSGLGGGNYGRLYPIEGNQSMWCGARPNSGDPVLCAYASLPGYGNSWDQALCSAACLSVTSDVVINFSASWDSESGYDATFLEIDNCDDNWQPFHGGFYVWDGNGSDTYSLPVSNGAHSGSLRFRFHFTSDGAYSDQDGVVNTDGAFIVDEVTVTDAGGTVVPYEDFEDEAVGDNDADDWSTCTPAGFGDFVGLYKGLEVVQEDFCGYNSSCFWGFFNGSIYDYACGGWPAMPTVPYGNTRGQYIRNEVWSPYIPVAGSGSSWELSFDVYRDLTFDAMVFYTYRVRSIGPSGCPGEWLPGDQASYGASKDWFHETQSIGQYIEPGAIYIQVALGVWDKCNDGGGSCTCHSHAPLLDNLSVYRIASAGPQWYVRDMDLFQDTFSEDGTITGTARADMANDILAATSARIQPGDSAVVTVADPDDGVDFHTPGDPASGPAVYCFVSVHPPGQPGKSGSDLIDDPRYWVVGTQTINGELWTQIQMDTTWTAAGSIVANRYNVDLDDDLFVPGDTVFFFFGARSAAPSNAWTYFSFPVRTASGQTHDVDQAAVGADEFTVLPAGGYQRGGVILYVDGMNNRGRELSTDYGVNYAGAQVFWDTAFLMTNLYDKVDRYDIRDPSAAVGNHPPSRINQISQQFTQIYRRVLWDCGDLETAFSDGTGSPDKSDDAGLLFLFLQNLTNSGGVYLTGDDVSDVWRNDMSGASAVQLRTTFMNYNVVTGDQTSTVGIYPFAVGETNGIFDFWPGPDTLVAYGGCRELNDFDILEAQGSAVLEMSYHGNGNTAGAVVSQTTMNSWSRNVGFVLSGFAYSYIRDDTVWPVMDRTVHLVRILRYLGQLVNDPTGAQTADYSYALSQNYPNPFNPTTTIHYSIAERGQVSLKIYDVSGQLVRTLVDEVQSPGAVESVRWNGLNNDGQAVSSGVYFYKLVTKDYAQTKKMVLLK